MCFLVVGFWYGMITTINRSFLGLVIIQLYEILGWHTKIFGRVSVVWDKPQANCMYLTHKSKIKSTSLKFIMEYEFLFYVQRHKWKD